MNDKYQITSDGTIFEVLSDGSIKKIGRIASDGRIDTYKSSNSSTSTSTSSNNSNVAGVFAWLFAIALFVVGTVCLNQKGEIDSLSSRNSQLQSKVETLEDKNQSLSSEVKNLRTQNSSLQSQNDNLKQNQPLKISDVKVGVVNYDGDIIVNYGNTIYSSQTRYLKPQITLYSYSSKFVTFYIKLYTPNGMSTGSSSPSGYSYTSEHYLTTGTNTIQLGGWGNNTSGNWQSGNYRYEIWLNGICLKQHSFYIY